MTMFQLFDVQGLVMSGYARMKHARYLLLRINNLQPARRWLAAISGRITTSEKPEVERCINIAFSYHGMARLGLDRMELSTFSVPFQEGMTTQHRRRLLGDAGPSDPNRWLWGGPGDEYDVLLLLFARDEKTIEHLEERETSDLNVDDGLVVVNRLTPAAFPRRERLGKFGVEHFGFATGMSQPVIQGSRHGAGPVSDETRRSAVQAGEFVLGYDNNYGILPPAPQLMGPGGEDFGRGGTYLVLRHLAQDVAGFWSFLRDVSGSPGMEGDNVEMEALASKLVGRWPSGAPLVQAPEGDDPSLGANNAFGYADVDPYGERCPLGAHIRRSNPRDSLGPSPEMALRLTSQHRILRRGRVYGPALEDPLSGDDGLERGLFFMCLNASIERQFEFVQQSWCNNTKFAGLYDEYDPLVGSQPDSGGRFTLQEVPIRRRISGLRRFVTVRGGGYFFLPGIGALNTLAALER